MYQAAVAAAPSNFRGSQGRGIITQLHVPPAVLPFGDILANLVITFAATTVYPCHLYTCGGHQSHVIEQLNSTLPPPAVL